MVRKVTDTKLKGRKAVNDRTLCSGYHQLIINKGDSKRG